LLGWLVDELEEFVTTSPHVEEDEMSLNYAINDIIRMRGHLHSPPGIDMIRGRAYNTNYCILSYEQNGLVAYRYEPARDGNYYAQILDPASPSWSHRGRSKPDIMAVHRNQEFHFRLELKAPGDQPDVRCWNEPFRRQIIDDLNRHVRQDPNTALLMVMSEMAYRRSRGETWEDLAPYNLRAAGGIPPVGDIIPFPELQHLIDANADETPLVENLQWEGDELRVIYRLYRPTSMETRTFIIGSISGRWINGERHGFCSACAQRFDQNNRDPDMDSWNKVMQTIEQHYRNEHPGLRETREPEYRVVVGITQQP